MRTVIDILNELKPGEDINENTELMSSGIISSMEIVQLVMELNDEFDIEISPMDITLDNFETPLKISNLVEKYMD